MRYIRITGQELRRFKLDYPRLDPNKILGLRTYEYNCYSWALGRTDLWINNAQDFDNLEGLIERFEAQGYTEKRGRKERIAIYQESDGWVTHAARTIEIDGRYTWTSKIGSCYLVAHRRLTDLVGPWGGYGKVSTILYRN